MPLHAMEPMLPSEGKLGPLRERALELVRRAAALGGALRPPTRASVATLLRAMNSYYSNLIEGHNTHPVTIDRALKADYSDEPARRALQLESVAHIEVQKHLERRVADEPGLNVSTTELLCFIHGEFYRRMPDEFRAVKDDEGVFHRFEPGRLRTQEVRVGRHHAPLAHDVPALMDRFARAYEPRQFDGLTRVIAAAAAHHRLAWIHPFLDGNGRVARLFSDAYLVRAGVSGHGLWAMSRGLARRQQDYMAKLAAADEERRNDYDGRGALSERALIDFCAFFLDTALDQVTFMTSQLDIDGLEARVTSHVERLASEKRLKPEAAHMLREALLRGEVSRGDVLRASGLPTRTAQSILSQLLKLELLESSSIKGPVRFAFPTAAVGYYFPRLYPEGVEASLDR